MVKYLFFEYNQQKQELNFILMKKSYTHDYTFNYLNITITVLQNVHSTYLK